jgi:hypothetical protein
MGHRKLLFTVLNYQGQKTARPSSLLPSSSTPSLESCHPPSLVSLIFDNSAEYPGIAVALEFPLFTELPRETIQ